MRSTNEYVIEWVEGDKIAAITCPENSSLSNRLIKLAGKYPEEVQMSHSEFFHVPKSWVNIRPPKKYNLTEEQKAERIERLSKAKSSRT